MKLVDYLRSLFKATSARPQETPQKMELAEGEGNFPVSQDCWVSLQCSDPKPSPYSCYLWGESHLNHATASSSSMQQAGWTVQALGFYRKGQRVFYSANGFKNVSALIFPIVGGGNILHSLGGVLCLLSSSVHYSKRLLAVRKVGLVTSLCHQAKLLNCLLSQNKFKGIQLHAMGGLLYLRKELEQVFVTLGHRISDAHLMVVGAQLLSCSEKASSLTTNSNQIRQTLEYSSSSPSALYNLSFGGASC